MLAPPSAALDAPPGTPAPAAPGAERTLTGTGLDGAAVTLTGTTALIARCQPDGTWLTAAGQWLPCPVPEGDRSTG